MRLALPASVAAGLFVALAALPAGEAKKPVSKFPLGKDTTVVEGPLDKDGYIDYEAALNARLGKGISPDKNANVLLFKAIGPKPEGSRMLPGFYEALGCEEPPAKGDYLIPLWTYLRDVAKLGQGEVDEVLAQYDRAGLRPWAAKDYPHLTGWLAANEAPLNVAVEATRRPEYFNPLIARRMKERPGILISALLPNVQRCRELAGMLTARAMLRVRDCKFDQAWEDLLACHRLGRLVARGACLIELLVGIAIDTIASRADLAYLDKAPLSAKDALGKLKELQTLPPMPTPADKIDFWERLVFLDCLQLVRRGGVGVVAGLDNGPEPKEITPEEEETLSKVDWKPALKNGNKWFDRLAKALRGKDRAARLEAVKQFDAELKALKAKTPKPEDLVELVPEGGDPVEGAGEVIGNAVIAALMPHFAKVQDASDRTEQIQRNLQLAFALAAYKREKGKYPAKLDALAPKYLASIPKDVFSGEPLVYTAEKGGYLLYSVGPNGRDEGGRWYDDEPAGDDPGVRMPLPALKNKN